MRFWRKPPDVVSPNLSVPLDRVPCTSRFPQGSRPSGSSLDAKMTDAQGEVYSFLSPRYTTNSRRWGPPLTAQLGLIAPASRRGYAHNAGETDAPDPGKNLKHHRAYASGPARKASAVLTVHPSHAHLPAKCTARKLTIWTIWARHTGQSEIWYPEGGAVPTNIPAKPRSKKLEVVARELHREDPVCPL